MNRKPKKYSHNINDSDTGFIPSTVYGTDQYQKAETDRFDDTPIDFSATDRKETGSSTNQ